MKHYKRPLFTSILVFIFFCGFFLASRCTFKKPVSPSWDVRIILPLFGRKYTMRELAEDNDQVRIENGDVVLSVREDIEPFRVGDNLRTAGASVDKIVTFGSISDSVALPDTVVVTRAVIKRGHIDVKVTNNNGRSAHARFVMGDLTLDGKASTAFTMEFDVEAYQITTVTQYLDDYRFDTVPSQGRNVIKYTATLSGGFPGEMIDIHIDVSEMVYRSMTGRIKEIQFDFSDVNADVDLPEEIEGFQVGSASAELTMHNGIQFPAQVNSMTIKGINKKNETAIVAVPITNIPKAVGGQMSSTTVNILNMQNIINLFPNKITLSGRAKVGDNYTEAVVTERDSVSGSILFRVPLVFTLPSRKNDVKVDTIEIKDEETRIRIREDAYNAKLTIDLENSLPVGFTLYFLFSKRPQDAGDNLYNVLNLSAIPEGVLVDTLFLPLGLLDNGSPASIAEPGKKSFSISLSQKDIQVFDSPQVFSGVRIDFTGTQGKMVKVRPGDYIYLKASMDFLVRADFEEKTKGGGS